MSSIMLTIKNVHTELNEETILKDISLECKRGEIQVIIGPKFSGKSALAHTIAGDPFLSITQGNIKFNQKNITKLSAGARNLLGIFLIPQNPPDIEGITNLELLEYSLNSRNLQLDDVIEKRYEKWCEYLGLGKDNKKDFVNHWSRSPAIWKKNELALTLTLEPDLMILDEIDSGLEDDISHVANIIKIYVRSGNKSCITFTGNQDFLNELIPDQIHFLNEGEIIESRSTNLSKGILIT